jgi:hypothetical protein
MHDDAHTYDSPNLDAGVWPKAEGLPRHFQLVGTNARALAVLDMGGLITVGGIDVYDPDHLDEFAARIARLATVYRERTAS